MKNRIPSENPNGRKEKTGGSNFNRKKMQKNMKRLGGGGLSLETFANAKTRGNHYNPALIKKQREFYKNAKYVSKYKRSLKQQGQQNDPAPSAGFFKDNSFATGDDQMKPRRDKNKKKTGALGLEEVYKRKREEDEKVRIERETFFQAKKEEKERSQAKRKSLREKMFKKTKNGQPVMKYRIEHILETLQNQIE